MSTTSGPAPFGGRGPGSRCIITDKNFLERITADFSEHSPTNYLTAETTDEKQLQALSNGFYTNNFARNNYYGQSSDGTALNTGKPDAYVGLRFFMPPLIAVGSADDEGFLKLKDPEVVGPHHLMPADWLPGAKTVISLFLPFSERVIRSNAADPKIPSMEWLFTRVDGQQHLLAMGEHVRDALVKEGYKAVVPYADDRYVMRVSPDETHLPIPPYSSNWSERHVGFITGLGTFGRMTNFISKRGACGRLISVVTDWETAPDLKDYEGVYDYCSECLACYRACPGEAFDKNGKSIVKCREYIHEVCKPFAPRYGCGKCQSGLPCATKCFSGKE